MKQDGLEVTEGLGHRVLAKTSRTDTVNPGLLAVKRWRPTYIRETRLEQLPIAHWYRPWRMVILSQNVLSGLIVTTLATVKS